VTSGRWLRAAGQRTWKDARMVPVRLTVVLVTVVATTVGSVLAATTVTAAGAAAR
jgi:hypothetical protein